MPQQSISVVPSVVFTLCDFVDRYFCLESKDDPRSHTNQREPKFLRLERDVKLLSQSHMCLHRGNWVISNQELVTGRPAVRT